MLKCVTLYVLFACYSFSSIGQVNLNSGLVASYPFNGNANDASPNGHNGLLHNGVKLTTDRFGNSSSAYLFDGVDDYISVPDDGNLSSPQFSLALWFLTESDDLQNIVGKRKLENDGTPGGGAQYQLFINYAPYPGIGSNIVSNNASCYDATSSSYINTGNGICAGRWIFVVVTFNGVNHRLYINGILKQDVPSSFNGMLICNSELRFGNWWSGGYIPFKGKIDDVRWYNRPLNQDEVTALYGNFSGMNSSSSDFTFYQDVCNPNQVKFINNTPNTNSITWKFGDGTSSAETDPSHNYPLFGNYKIDLVTTNTNNCIDSVSKVVNINSGPGKLFVTKDTTVCAGQPVTLKVIDGFLPFCLTPFGSQPGSDNLLPVVTPSTNSTYYFTTLLPETNLVINGDFSGGNSGFSSDYTYVSTNQNNLEFGVNNNAAAWNAGFSNCTDHTGSNGKMMVATGISASASSNKIWSETITVLPNTNYVFSSWFQSLNNVNNTTLILSVNNVQMGNGIVPGSVPCKWTRFYISWNSGNNTSAIISIVNAGPSSSGNAFAIDDIFFAKYKMAYDSVILKVLPLPSLKTIADTSICIGSSIQLNTSGAVFYSWAPSTALSDPSISNPVASPSSNIKYVISAYNDPGCIAKDSVIINVTALPVFTINPVNQEICQGQEFGIIANGGDTYNWYDANTRTLISNSSSFTETGTNSNTFLVYIHNNSCNINDTLSSIVTVNPAPVLSITKSNDINCINPAAELIGSGGTTYRWYPATDISDTASADAIVYPKVNTWYKLTVTNDKSCSATDSVLVMSNLQAKDGHFYVPSAFTPNNDGKNDCFGVRSWSIVDAFEFWIYNRAGQLLFHSKDSQDCWDGTYKGMIQPTGTYVYQVKATSPCSFGPVYKKGLFTLIR